MGELIAGIVIALIGAYATVRAAKIEAGKDATDAKAGALLRRIADIWKKRKAAVVTVTIIALSLTA